MEEKSNLNKVKENDIYIRLAALGLIPANLRKSFIRI